MPVESVAVSVVPLLERLVVHGVLMTGEGPLLAAEDVDEALEEAFEDVGAAVDCDCAAAEEVPGLCRTKRKSASQLIIQPCILHIPRDSIRVRLLLCRQTSSDPTTNCSCKN